MSASALLYYHNLDTHELLKATADMFPLIRQI
jgi:hypothetical protein